MEDPCKTTESEHLVYLHAQVDKILDQNKQEQAKVQKTVISEVKRVKSQI